VDTLLKYGLVAIFLALILTPFGLPIPEDVSLLGAGVLTATGHAKLLHAVVVGYVGVVGSDVISWTFGRRVGLHPTGFIARLVGQEDIDRIERFFRRYGPWAIVIARNFPGMRLPAFFFAGASGISLPKFLLIDGLAACVTVGVFISLGRMFADDLSRVIAFLDNFRLIGGVAFVGLGAFTAWRVIRRRVKRREQRKTTPASPGPETGPPPTA
jgi:membrane protein DedA with SNARE-associated domain